MRRCPAAPSALLLAAATLALLSFAPAAAALKLQVDGQAVVDQLMHLAQWSDDPSPAVTRLLFTGLQLPVTLSGCVAVVVHIVSMQHWWHVTGLNQGVNQSRACVTQVHASNPHFMCLQTMT